jgi:sarcosine oxidase
VGVDVEPLTPEEGRKRFPVFRFEDAAGVLHDRTAGLVAAAQAVQSLIDLIRRQGGEIRENTTVQRVDITRDPIRVETSAGDFETERLIVTAGPWVSHLLPVLKSRVAVARQTVGFFQLEGAREEFQPGAFPVWGYLLRQGDISYYGLPQFGRDGIKLAKHIVSGVDDDPDDVPTQTPEDAIEDLRVFIKDQFVPPVERFIDWETCLYTNTGTEDFILDIHPDNPNVVIGAGFSGHGFKFGPLTGRILSDLSLSGKTSIPEFEAASAMFEIPLDDKAIKDLHQANKDREQGNKDAYINLDEL